MVALIATLVIIGTIPHVFWIAPLELARIVKDIASPAMQTVTRVTLNQAAPHVSLFSSITTTHRNVSPAVARVFTLTTQIWSQTIYTAKDVQSTALNAKILENAEYVMKDFTSSISFRVLNNARPGTTQSTTTAAAANNVDPIVKPALQSMTPAQLVTPGTLFMKVSVFCMLKTALLIRWCLWVTILMITPTLPLPA